MSKMKEISEKTRIVNNVSITCIFVNLLLSIGKVIVGVVGHSAAIITDAVNSIGDVISTIIIIVGNKVSEKASDKEHPYGHEKFECIFMLLFVFCLAYAGIEMFKTGVATIYSGIKDPLFIETLEQPAFSTMIISIITIVVKLIMTKVTFFYAKKVNSMGLYADGKNHELDVLTSVFIVIALIFSFNGIWFADAVASIVGCGFIVKLVVELFKMSIDGLVDKSASNEINDKAKEVALSVDGVLGISRMRSRQFGSRAFIDMEIYADANITLAEAEVITEKVHHAVQDAIEEVKHCQVHTDPFVRKETEC